MGIRKRLLITSLLAVLCITPVLAGCGDSSASLDDNQARVEVASAQPEEVIIEDEAVPLANSQAQILTPVAAGKTVYTGGNVVMDASNTAQGYVMVKYTGSNNKIKVQLTKSGGATYTYNLNARAAYEVFPLTEGNGSYTLKLFENVSGTKYSQAFSQTFSISLANQFLPFLYPNQYVNFNASSATVATGLKLTAGVADDIKKVEKIYDYVVDNITYDKSKATSVQSGYLPNVDSVLASKKGICFDYAAVMTTMLRSQNIPAKLVVGYSGNVYHAWINVYTPETGWVDNIIYFDGNKWNMMDPTFASSGKKSDSIMKYIGDGKNYQAKYAY